VLLLRADTDLPAPVRFTIAPWIGNLTCGAVVESFAYTSFAAMAESDVSKLIAVPPACSPASPSPLPRHHHGSVSWAGFAGAIIGAVVLGVAVGAVAAVAIRDRIRRGAMHRPLVDAF
jgi:hypothetical protein